MHRKKQSQQKELLLHFCLSILIVILLFINCYAVVKLFHGQAVFDLSQWFTGLETSFTPRKEPQLAEPQHVKNNLWNVPDKQPTTINQNLSVAPLSGMLALPENGMLSMEYFRDALFIGDSVTEGFAIYEPLRNISKIYGIRNSTPKTYLDNAAVVDHGHGKLKIPAIWDALAAEKPGKIYIMLGTNSIVSNPSDDAFLHFYTQVIERLKTTFPNVPIYVQGITPVSKATSEKNPNYALTRLHALNNKIAQMAFEQGVYYIDTHEALANEEGYLPDDITGYGGMHILPPGYVKWVDYLRTHTAYHPANIPFVERTPYQ